MLTFLGDLTELNSYYFVRESWFVFLATLSDWCLDSICFSSPDCFSSRVAVVKKMAAKGDVLALSELGALLYLFAT